MEGGARSRSIQGEGQVKGERLGIKVRVRNEGWSKGYMSSEGYAGSQSSSRAKVRVTARRSGLGLG